MKTAISIPDQVFRRAERLAKQRNMSRSELYTTALVQLLDAQPKDDLTRAYDAAFTDDADTDGFTREAARHTLLAVEWSDA
jgi:predicted transcriptional regulator